MSLDFDFSRCSGRESWTDRDMHMLDRLIWGAMVVDLGNITDANIEEWVFRMRLGDALLGPYFSMKYEGEERFDISPAHLRKFVGLTTNVSDATRHKWFKKVLAQATERFTSRVASEMQKEAMACV